MVSYYSDLWNGGWVIRLCRHDWINAGRHQPITKGIFPAIYQKGLLLLHFWCYLLKFWKIFNGQVNSSASNTSISIPMTAIRAIKVRPPCRPWNGKTYPSVGNLWSSLPHRLRWTSPEGCSRLTKRVDCRKPEECLWQLSRSARFPLWSSEQVEDKGYFGWWQCFHELLIRLKDARFRVIAYNLNRRTERCRHINLSNPAGIVTIGIYTRSWLSNLYGMLWWLIIVKFKKKFSKFARTKQYLWTIQPT